MSQRVKGHGAVTYLHPVCIYRVFGFWRASCTKTDGASIGGSGFSSDLFVQLFALVSFLRNSWWTTDTVRLPQKFMPIDVLLQLDPGPFASPCPLGTPMEADKSRDLSLDQPRWPRPVEKNTVWFRLIWWPRRTIVRPQFRAVRVFLAYPAATDGLLLISFCASLVNHRSRTLRCVCFRGLLSFRTAAVLSQRAFRTGEKINICGFGKPIKLIIWKGSEVSIKCEGRFWLPPEWCL